MHAYSELYLRNARALLANCLDYATYTLGYDTGEFYNDFIRTDLAGRFEKGVPQVLAGMSGIELALLITEKVTGRYEYKEPVYSEGRSPEYWAGWAIAYYQWYSACSLLRLEEEVPITAMLNMYDKYHEMDIMHFVDRINDLRKDRRLVSYLKKYRELCGYSQSELSGLTGIPIKTLQQYEQGQKSLAKANAGYVLSLARALNCTQEELINDLI